VLTVSLLPAVGSRFSGPSPIVAAKFRSGGA
jgi:hypothetical protein